MLGCRIITILIHIIRFCNLYAHVVCRQRRRRKELNRHLFLVVHFYVVIAQYQVVRAVIVHIDVLRFPLCHIKRRGQCHWLVNLRVALAVYGDIHRVLHVAVQVQFVRIRREADGDFVIVLQIGGVIIRLICTVVVVVGDIYQQIGLPLHVLSPVIGIGVGIEHILALSLGHDYGNSDRS